MSIKTFLQHQVIRWKQRNQQPERNDRLILPVNLKELKILEEHLNTSDYTITELETAAALLDKVQLLKKALESGDPTQPESFELRNNQFTIQHWAAFMFAESFHDSLASNPKAENYIELELSHPSGPIRVTIQRADKLSPAQKASKLQAELDELKTRVENRQPCTCKESSCK